MELHAEPEEAPAGGNREVKLNRFEYCECVQHEHFVDLIDTASREALPREIIIDELFVDFHDRFCNILISFLPVKAKE